MLNRFKNVIYGGITSSDDVANREGDQGFIKGRLRGTLTRSSSFRDELLAESGGNRGGYDNNSSSTRVNQITDSAKFKIEKHVHVDRPRQRREFVPRQSSVFDTVKVPKFGYSRPEFLQLKTEDEILVSADHSVRPIILPRDMSKLPWKSGYAECINAGKSIRNEDQAAFHRGTLRRSNTRYRKEIEGSEIVDELPWVYFGMFDGHAGTAVAIAAAAQLHVILGDKLQSVADLLIALEFESKEHDIDGEFLECNEDRSVLETQMQDDKSVSPSESSLTSIPNSSSEKTSEQLITNDSHDISTQTTSTEDINTAEIIQRAESQFPSQATTSPQNGRATINNDAINLLARTLIDVDSLVKGALESAFWDMDALIARDKQSYRMLGGCTAIVSLFILGKLYVSNAGDSRAIVSKNNKVIPMSFDFTPTSERERILRLGQQRPEFMGSDFTHLEFIRRPTVKDVGKQMLYKDAFMTGWSMKTITYDDLRFPLVWGEGKRSRALATIGVTRGFGDHELRAQFGSVPIKPFLTPEPEVRILPLADGENLSSEDVLIMGSDGLWDVIRNRDAADVVRNSFEHFSDNEESRLKYRFITAAQDLVINSRGNSNSWGTIWKTDAEQLGSMDDISCFVIPLKEYRDEYMDWVKMRSSKAKKLNSDNGS